MCVTNADLQTIAKCRQTKLLKRERSSNTSEEHCPSALLGLFETIACVRRCFQFAMPQGSLTDKILRPVHPQANSEELRPLAIRRVFQFKAHVRHQRQIATHAEFQRTKLFKLRHP